ncbi:MAG: Omp28-related outer membrane protein [Bacteroidales bacterium]|nr:Omp28-related outer membrane protein [Bacteroidales bacterium]
MKKILWLVGVVSTFLLFSCDDIKEDEFLTKVEGETTESTPITKTQNSQAVLLEDYTGWLCVNCPAAAALVEEMQTNYGEQLVAISVHTGSFAVPSSANNNLDLRTEYGNKWNTSFGFSEYPSGMVNRTYKDAGTSRIYQKDEWNNAVSSLLSNTSHLLNINMGAEINNNKIIVSAKYVAQNDINFPMYANVVVIESGITGIQFNKDATYGAVPKIEDYVFNHVLRNNGLIDLQLSTSSLPSQKEITKNYSINIDEKWNINNCKVVIFVTNANTGEIIQVNEIDL